MLAVVAMLAVACTAAPAGTPIVIFVTPSPSATEPGATEPSATEAAASATPALPTLEPTQQPTLAATPKVTPTAAPTFDTDSAIAALALLLRITAFGEAFSAKAGEMSEAASAGRMAKLRAIVDDMATLVGDEQQWLRANPPAACLEDLQEEWSDAIDLYSDGLDKMVHGLTPPVTAADIQEGAELFSLANDRIASVTLAMEGVCQ
jgi:hypothetical protein